jgi:hypothetical protein
MNKKYDYHQCDLFEEDVLSVGLFASLEPAKIPTDPTSPPNRLH